MKKILTTHDIADALCADQYANWSRAGAFAIAEWLEEMEESTGEETELDVVAIRCDFSEYESLFDWAIDYFGGIALIPEYWVEIVPGTNNTKIDEETVREYVQDNGILIEFDGGVIVSSF